MSAGIIILFISYNSYDSRHFRSAVVFFNGRHSFVYGIFMRAVRNDYQWNFAFLNIGNIAVLNDLRHAYTVFTENRGKF